MVYNFIVDKFIKLTYHITRLSRSLKNIKGVYKMKTVQLIFNDELFEETKRVYKKYRLYYTGIIYPLPSFEQFLVNAVKDYNFITEFAIDMEVAKSYE